MTREDIERMARAAKGHAYTNRYTPGETAFAFSIDRLEHFAALVYERGFVAGMKNEEQITIEAVAAERERNAQIADAYAQHNSNNSRKGEEMNTEDVIKLMLQTEPEMAIRIKEHEEGMEGFTEEDPKLINFWPFKNYVKFAALVAAAERQRCADIADAHASIEGIAQKIAAEIRGQG